VHASGGPSRKDDCDSTFNLNLKTTLDSPSTVRAHRIYAHRIQSYFSSLHHLVAQNKHTPRAAPICSTDTMLRTFIAAAIGASAAARSSSSSSLFDVLSSFRFLHEGVVNATDTFTLSPVPCAYLEPENVTDAPAAGIGWTEGGACPFLWLTNASSGPGSCNAEPPSPGYDREGGDYRAFPLPSGGASACSADCCADSICMAWAYTPTAPPGQVPCASGTPCCYLKSTVEPQTPNPNVTSGVVDRAPVALTPPPVGVRSAVPLGGVGAGAVELRADGTFREATIVNQSPAGAAKYGILADAWLGVRAGGVARLLRTSPPGWAPAGDGVSSLAYSGAYPVTRLTPAAGDFPIPVALYAFSKLVPGDPVASAAPAIVFSIAASNPTASPVNLSLIFATPLAAVSDCARVSSTPPLSNMTTPTAAACLHACAAAAPSCASWTWNGDGAQECRLATDIPLSVYQAGAFCGLPGSWSSGGGGGSAALTLTMPCASAGNASPACGDTSVSPVLGDGSVVSTASAGVADDPSALWASFAASGGIEAGAPGVTAAGSFIGAEASLGAAAITVVIPPGANGTATLVWSWYFPHRDHVGVDIGQYYSTLFSGSADVASSLGGGDGEGIVDTAADLVAHHSVFLSPNSSLPPWLADMMVNQMSHFRGMIWTRDGRMREFEAFDCADLDSIHNDYQRHLPYLWLMPQFEIEKLRRWGSGQVLPDGYIQEFLGPFYVGPFDVPGGRIMGDTTTLWIVELFEVWRNTADDSLLAELWPVAARAISWTATNAAEIGLPWKLYSTYDILWLDGYNTTSYNAMLYLAALRAGAILAAAVNDTATGALAASALARAEAAVQTLLWDNSTGTGGHFRAYSWNNDSAVMADTLYGQVIATGLGLGWLAPPAQLGAHLATEVARNGNPYGFRAVTGRVSPPPGGQTPNDDANWQQAGPDWSALALALIPEGASPAGVNLTAALEPARMSLENWRERVRSLWNICGITSTDTPANEALQGMPTVTSHYGFQLVSYWILPILAGQVVNLPAGSLTFTPALSCPLNLPMLLAGTTGTISCDAGGVFTVSVAFGSLTLPPGGLVANGRAYPSAVDLGAGESVTW
jgi:non-lysosomal glucosylceramidase